MPLGRRRSLIPLTPLELEIMGVLWDRGPLSVQDVQRLLRGEPSRAYTTVQTMLNVLHRKGKVKRKLKGKAFRYQAIVSREKVISQILREITNRLFGGSAESLVMSLIKNHHLTPEKLANLNRVIEQSCDTASDTATRGKPWK
ncbi:MAG: BlaI/MecI/CopY family transcriptional regulator [Terriglobia bacterium]